MKGMGVRAFGGADALELLDWPVPRPGPGEARVRLAVAGVNFMDVYMRSGQYARSQTYTTPLPLLLGMEGAGGVGQLLVQLAKARGARVLATVGSADKAAIAKSLGADEAILYREVDFRQAVRDLTGGAGVDVVYDSVGRDTIHQSIRSLKRRGTCVMYGASSGQVEGIAPLELAEAGSVFFTRPHLADYMQPHEVRERARHLFSLVRAGKLRVAIDRTFPLGRLAEAHRVLESRGTRGKLLVSVAA